MKLKIEQPYIDAIMGEFYELSCLGEQFRSGKKCLVDMDHLSNTSIAYLHHLYEKSGPTM